MPNEYIKSSSSIQFDINQFSILTEHFSILKEIANILRTNVKSEIIISGYTDNIGSMEHNYRLSKQRVDSTKLYFINYGIQPNRISSLIYGEHFPKSTNLTTEGKIKNRRVELNIL
ncbi:OmpA family protein [Vibrio lamellibrachiae]|uniref:OmpA family protein n=1 Tax=Vibrio lamellibrachiae TaxID=2910253 RepID=UPI003D0D3ACF